MEQVAAVAVIDARGVATGRSEGARLLTDCPADEAPGRPEPELLADALPMRTDGAWSGPVLVRHRDGGPVAVTVTACPVLGPGCRLAGLTVTARPPGPSRPSPDSPSAPRRDHPALGQLPDDPRQDDLVRAEPPAQRSAGVDRPPMPGR
ncbi:hypothetical protein [Streptomyces sp. NPDC088254]|uniref:hypothetical protein n=1 Tax=Streptomyces sp. NPDC088254 TaxID=3365847 RepID=UPI0037FBFA33